ncbi:PREDICTED: uncharacterized protein LOC18613390 isoform X1 [Theobroma cacao]|uniref:Uncharacterized protein LOC18613390 isoform X1 n=1 Tax=Theobroma cacao TaxID=3641 RepID=A0AB32VR73_THECC|nr:PREDICTED: uncharacterized protein LOC18613390 isoform X1 [Theobroma cacao]
MDVQQGHGNPLMSLNSGGGASDFSYDYVNDSNPHFPMAAGRSENQLSPQSLSQWIDCPKTPHSYVEFLTENLEKVPTSDVLERIGSPVGGVHALDGISEIQRELLHNNAGKAFSSRLDDYSLESEHGKLKLSAYATNSNNCEASASERFLRPHDRLSVSRFSSSEYESHAQQTRTFWMQEPNEDNCNVFQLQPKETISAFSFLSQPHCSVPKLRASGSDRQRRLRIAESIRALQELLPNPAERGQATALDDIIDHVKFLQLQMKELSRSRLGGEPTSNPFVFLEGYGHYALHEQMMNEPLEEMMGKLLEINPPAATQLLESRGLFMMPRALVDGLHRVT